MHSSFIVFSQIIAFQQTQTVLLTALNFSLYYNFTTTFAQCVRYFDLTSNIGSQFAASLLDQLLASQPKNPETIEQDKAEREQIITRATTAATKAGYAEGTKEGVEDEASAIRLGKIAGKYLKRRERASRIWKHCS